MDAAEKLYEALTTTYPEDFDAVKALVKKCCDEKCPWPKKIYLTLVGLRLKGIVIQLRGGPSSARSSSSAVSADKIIKLFKETFAPFNLPPDNEADVVSSSQPRAEKPVANPMTPKFADVTMDAEEKYQTCAKVLVIECFKVLIDENEMGAFAAQLISAAVIELYKTQVQGETYGRWTIKSNHQSSWAPGPGPGARSPGPGARGPGPGRESGPKARAPGPGPRARGPGSRGLGPKSSGGLILLSIDRMT